MRQRTMPRCSSIWYSGAWKASSTKGRNSRQTNRSRSVYFTRISPRLTRVRKRQYVRASRSRSRGDQIASSASAGRVRSAACTERTAPSAPIEVCSSGVSIRAWATGRPLARRRATSSSAPRARTATTTMAATVTSPRSVCGLLLRGRRELSGRVHEGLVDDLPLALDLGEGEEVDERDRSPEPVLLEDHVRDVVGLLDGRDSRHVAALDVDGVAVEHRDHLADRHVIALAAEAAPHVRVGVEGLAQLRAVALAGAVDVELDRLRDLLGVLSGRGHAISLLGDDAPSARATLLRQRLERHDLAGREFAFAPRDQRQRIGAEHRGEDVRSLWPGGACPAVVVETHADGLLARRVARQRLGEHRVAAPGWSGALQRRHGRTGEQHERDQRRDGVAGQAEHERVAACAEPRRLAGAQRDAPEALLDPEVLQGRLDVVVRADRDTAGDEDEVGFAERGLERRAGRVTVVARAARPDDQGSRPARERGERERVRVMDLARPERLTGIDELVAGGHDRDPGPLCARERRAAGRDPNPEFGRPQPRAGLENDLAGAQVLAGAAHVVARRDR